MIKNFFVKSKVIKNKSRGLTNYVNYLKNNEHKNHKGKTEKILHILDNDFIINTKKKITTKEIETQQNKRGGSSFQSYRQSFCLSFPTDVKTDILTDEKLKQIAKKVIKEIFIKMEIPLTDENLHQIFCNVHFNENIHINIVLPKVMNNKTYDFSKKGLIVLVKKVFDLQVEGLGISKNDYKPKTQNNSKTLKQYKDSQERKKIYLESRSRLIEVKQLKDNMINIKTDDINFINFKKVFYGVINKFIKDFTTISSEKKKEKKTVDMYKIKEEYEKVLPELLEVNKKGIGMLDELFKREEEFKKKYPELYKEQRKQYIKKEEEQKNITKNPIKTTENIKEVEIPKKVEKSYYEGLKSFLGL